MQCYTALMREYGLLRSRRKTLALELKKDGTLLVRAPMRLAKREIDRFVAAHEDWIEKHLEKLRASPALPKPTPEETEALKAAAWAVLPERACLVFGSEASGLSVDMIRACEIVVAITQRGSTRSMNVGHAAAIVMWAHASRLEGVANS